MIQNCQLRLPFPSLGIPLQTTTDRGTETIDIFGFANALRLVKSLSHCKHYLQTGREIFSPDFPVDELPAHRFLKSVHNIVIERGWLRLRTQWGDNVKLFFDSGESRYNPNDPVQ